MDIAEHTFVQLYCRDTVVSFPVHVQSLFACSELPLPDAAVEAAKKKDFELAGYRYTPAPESTRKPRIVRIGMVQNKIVLPTTAPVAEQVRACSICVPTHGPAGVWEDTNSS